MTKGMAAMLVYTTTKCNYNHIVIVHQHGGYDVTCKPRIGITIHILGDPGVVHREGENSGLTQKSRSPLSALPRSAFDI